VVPGVLKAQAGVGDSSSYYVPGQRPLRHNVLENEMNPIPSYLVLYWLDDMPHECVTYFPDFLEYAFRSIGVYAEVLSVLLMEQAI
jgi:hypothetical protein